MARLFTSLSRLPEHLKHMLDIYLHFTRVQSSLTTTMITSTTTQHYYHTAIITFKCAKPVVRNKGSFPCSPLCQIVFLQFSLEQSTSTIRPAYGSVRHYYCSDCYYFRAAWSWSSITVSEVKQIYIKGNLWSVAIIRFNVAACNQYLITSCIYSLNNVHIIMYIYTSCKIFSNH